jgi:transposase, IS30 family
MAGHLTLEEREIIAHMHRAGKMQTQIAERLGRDKSTISRELRRNRSRNGYWAVAAQRKAERRRNERPWVAKLQRMELRRYVSEHLRRRWSPDQIAGRARNDFPRDWRRQISPPTIYAWIRAEAARGKHWQRYLRRLGRKRPDWEKRGRLPTSVSIEGRPAVVDRRSRYGDWEGDTIVGAHRRGGALTLVERKSGYLLLAKVLDLQAATIRQAAAQRYATVPTTLRKTLTLDNGKEFAEHEALEEEAALQIYFAKPYSAWQRGTNENTNGLVRDFFPKGTDLASLPEHRFTKVQQLLNDRPRKRLNYKTPNEVLASRLQTTGCD